MLSKQNIPNGWSAGKIRNGDKHVESLSCSPVLLGGIGNDALSPCANSVSMASCLRRESHGLRNMDLANGSDE